MITREELIEKLVTIGFELYDSSSSTYRCELVASNETQQLTILIRKNGVDYQFDNDTKVRNHYNDSNIAIHRMTLKLAKKFLENAKLDEAFFENHGSSYRRIRQVYSGSPRMVEGYQQTSDGEAYVYMGDGTYIHPDDAWW
jgi:hypothetical protein